MGSSMLGRTRQAITTAVRNRVNGPDFATGTPLWTVPGDRWFTPADAIWRVHRDPAMFIGGIRSLLLQSLHPVAMQAVSEHSGQGSDPWGRLQRANQFVNTTTYGTVAEAEQAIAKVHHVHGFVQGVTPEGEPYEAGDPHLLKWVHIVDVESFLLAHQAYGERPLTPERCDEYVAQTAVVAEQLGVIDPPRTRAELETQLMSYRLELRRTEAAVEAAELLLRRPPLPKSSRPAYRMLVHGALALTPPWALARLRVPYYPVRELMAPPIARAACRTLRWAFAVDPVHTPPPARD
ncbi:oxygenase MpaB family protein [Propionibacteriaceae bacterium Y2011]|uniref:oxygenase MpaB family protein n=1 Tax=Microlunatus sp. Y2014 TaxID=3418488 RepID=UPI003B4679D2